MFKYFFIISTTIIYFFILYNIFNINWITYTIIILLLFFLIRIIYRLLYRIITKRELPEFSFIWFLNNFLKGSYLFFISFFLIIIYNNDIKPYINHEYKIANSNLTKTIIIQWNSFYWNNDFYKIINNDLNRYNNWYKKIILDNSFYNKIWMNNILQKDLKYYLWNKIIKWNNQVIKNNINSNLSNIDSSSILDEYKKIYWNEIIEENTSTWSTNNVILKYINNITWNINQENDILLYIKKSFLNIIFKNDNKLLQLILSKNDISNIFIEKENDIILNEIKNNLDDYNNFYIICNEKNILNLINKINKEKNWSIQDIKYKIVF